MAEVGSTAAITEVNKIRSGGLGGFFCREEFEVFVGDGTTEGRGLSSADRSYRSGDEPGTGGARRELDGRDARFRALLERRLNETSLTEADLAQEPIDRHLGPDEPFVIQPPTPASFGAGTEPTPGATDDRQTRAGARPQPPPYVVEYGRNVTRQPSAPAGDESFRLQPPLPADVDPVRADEQPTLDLDAAPSEDAGLRRFDLDPDDVADRPGETRSDPDRPSTFWLRLRRAKRELEAARPPDAGVRAIVGPLALTTPVVRLLQCEHRLGSNDVIVLTSRAEIVSEPSWQLVRSSHQMLEAAGRRAGQPTLLVVDVPVELPVWVDPLLDRLRRADLGLIRYAVPGTPSELDLVRYRDEANLPYVIDLVSKVRPDDLARIIDAGHPVATIAGIELNAELLMALREQVSLG